MAMFTKHHKNAKKVVRIVDDVVDVRYYEESETYDDSDVLVPRTSKLKSETRKASQRQDSCLCFHVTKAIKSKTETRILSLFK